MRISGGLPVEQDGRVHGSFHHNPSTLRLSMANPSLHQIPRAGGLASYVKDMFRAPKGYVFFERDFSAIEAVLVGFFAGDPSYIRFAKLGVHDFLCSHMIGAPADLTLSDADLKAYFKSIKKEHPAMRDQAKRVIHGSNYLMTANRMHQLFPEVFPTLKAARDLQGLYFELFPSIRKWHRDVCNRVDGTKRRVGDEQEKVDPWTLGVCYARNPFNYVHRFYSVLEWEKIGTEWVSTLGDDSKRLVAFLPQSTAAAIIKQAAKRLYYDYREPVGESLRLLIHDSILGECKEEHLDECLKITQEVMEAPIPELPLDPTWGLGEFLTIQTEAKSGTSWGSM